MERFAQPRRLLKLFIHDHPILSTVISYALILAIYVNLSVLESPLIGILASVPYLLINAAFFGQALFKKERALLRLTLGFLAVIILLGFTGWLFLVIHNLDILSFTLVLLIAATISFLFNRRMRHDNAAR